MNSIHFIFIAGLNFIQRITIKHKSKMNRTDLTTKYGSKLILKIIANELLKFR